MRLPTTSLKQGQTGFVWKYRRVLPRQGAEPVRADVLDRLISRTLAYAVVGGVVVGVYVGVVRLVTKVIGFSSPVGVAASTLAAVALFNPLRRRIQRFVDRRLNRARYDAEATVAVFFREAARRGRP